MNILEHIEVKVFSRSQAKRLILSFDYLEEVILDFNGIEFIGQAFADEIFRVYRNQHPDVKINYVNANKDVEKMILHVMNYK